MLKKILVFTAIIFSFGVAVSRAEDITITTYYPSPAGNYKDLSVKDLSVDQLILPATTSPTVGVINQNGSQLIHSYGIDNFFAGRSAGNFTETGWGLNVGVGSGVLSSNTTGYWNTASGYRALFSNATGGSNAAFGHEALYLSNTSNNAAFGARALRSTTVGSGNTAIGSSALNRNTHDVGNTAVGTVALNVLTNVGPIGNNLASYNTAVGAQIFPDLIDGRSNTAIGYDTGRGIINGSQNTIIGANVGGLPSNLSNNIIIADGSGNRRINVDNVGRVGIGTVTPAYRLDVVATDDGSAGAPICIRAATSGLAPGVLLYNDAGGYYGSFGAANSAGKYVGTSLANDITIKSVSGGITMGACGGSVPCASPKFMRMDVNGNVGIGTATPGSTLTIFGTGWMNSAWVNGSDVRWKKDIAPLEGSLGKVMQLNPVSYNWRKDEFPDQNFNDDRQLGLIAQEVEKVIPELVTTDNNGFKGISYEKLTPVLVAAIQEQQKQINDLKAEVEKLKKK